MDTFTRDDLKNLLEHHDGACLSIFMPTGTDSQAAPIRLRNLLREAEQQLLVRGMRTPDVKAFLEPLENLPTDNPFWREQSRGLAIFRSADFLQSYRLQLGFAELVNVGARFHVKPLLPLLSGDGRFYVLALSQNAIRLLEGTRQHISEVELDNMPTSLAEALKEEVVEKQVQFRSGRSSAGGRRAAVFKGYGGGGEEEDKERILRYFRQIEHGLQDVLRNEQAPLVLAGVDYLHPLYRQVNTYPYLVEGSVAGNPDTLKPAELHARAWVNAQLVFLRGQQEAIARYNQLGSTERASNQIDLIVPAAYYGRVEVLLVDCSVVQWGCFNPETNSMVLHDRLQPGDEDLLDLAATHTLLNSGDVYALQADAMPGKAAVAAVFRY